MKIAVISDTHIHGGSYHPKKLMSRFINKVDQQAEQLCELVRPWFHDADVVIHAGDFVSYAVVTALEEFAPVEGVAGNMDPQEIRSRLPVKTVVKAGSRRIGVIHGHGAPHGMEKRVRPEFEDVDCIVFGHTHHPFNAEVGGVQMFNPGSPTDKRWAPSHGIGLIHVEDTLRCENVALD
ncbi:MAG: metallophosphoesterase family protein [bacterium]